MSPPYNPSVVANLLISLAHKNKDEAKLLTPMKLIKLVYITHACALVISKQPMINTPVKAWKYGPVIPSLYHELKQYGSSPVTNLIENTEDTSSINEADRKMIIDTSEAFKSWDGFQLSTFTHQADSAWTKARERASIFNNTPEITDLETQEWASTFISE